MKKKILSLFMALSLALTAMPTVAWADSSSDTDWVAYVKEEIPFTKGNETAPEWIDRIDLPEFAKDFYDVLTEASDGDGNADYLMDAKYYNLDTADEMQDEPIWVISDEQEDGTEYKSIILEATSVTLQDDLEDAQKELVARTINDYVSAAYTAFDADHPEVFWLYRKAFIGGFSFTTDEGELKYVAGLTLAEYQVDEDNAERLYQNRVQQFLNDADELYIDGEFIEKPDDVTSKQAVAAWATDRANEIIGEFSETLEGFKAHLEKNGLISREDLTADGLDFYDLTDAGKIAYFDYWLVSHNDYNTDQQNETETSFGGSLDAISARECISAMVGKKGNQGPVCAGFARGMKALCDTAGIGCVIVNSILEQEHIWNYVQVDNGDWFGLDTTWNEAKGEAVTDYLLANKAAMEAGHTVQNKVWGNIIFPDAPVLQESRFAFAPGWLVSTAENNTPVFSPNGGSFRGAQTVAITAPEGYEIYYTTDGSLPNQDLTVTGNTTMKYEKEITLTATTTIKAIAVKGDVVSAVAEAAFTRKHGGGSSGGGTTTKPAEKPTETPADLKIPVDTKNVKDVNKLTLAKFNPETGELEFIDSSYDAKGKAVVSSATEAGDYFVVEKDNLTTITLQIDNRVVTLNHADRTLDAAPVISQDRTMVPLRFIAEAFGANVSWEDATKTVTIAMEDKVLTMKIGQELEGFGAAPIISNGRTMVPISYISKELGANVVWIPATKTVSIAK